MWAIRKEKKILNSFFTYLVSNVNDIAITEKRWNLGQTPISTLNSIRNYIKKIISIVNLKWICNLNHILIFVRPTFRIWIELVLLANGRTLVMCVMYKMCNSWWWMEQYVKYLWILHNYYLFIFIFHVGVLFPKYVFHLFSSLSSFSA